VAGEEQADSTQQDSSDAGQTGQSEEAILTFSEMETTDFHGSETLIKMLDVNSFTVRTEQLEPQPQQEGQSEQPEDAEPK
jgi:hypothetical protein